MKICKDKKIGWCLQSTHRLINVESGIMYDNRGLFGLNNKYKHMFTKVTGCFTVNT